MIPALRIFIVSVFISATLIYSRIICFQTSYFINYSNEQQSHDLYSLNSVDFVILSNTVKSVFEQLSQKAEKTIFSLHLWRNVHKIAFYGKDLFTSIRILKSIFYKIKIFSPPDIIFPFDYYL